ncbi:MAG TPA: PAS domain S-box protein, partial [Spirochaetota bacterium]|nr:PAS domain S-box protein [Spirochaetota bacterium]
MKENVDSYLKYTIYLTEDDEGLRYLIESKLKKSQFKTKSFANGNDLLKEIQKEKEEFLLILDYNLPDFTGKNLIEKILEMNPNINFMIMTGYGDEKIAVDVMKMGAKDYLVKDANFLELLISTVNQVIGQIETEKELIKTQENLKESEEKYRLITENSNALICEIDTDGKFVYVNSHYEKELGYKPEELIGEDSIKLGIKEELQEVKESYKKLSVDLIPFKYELQIKHKEGYYKWYECNSSAFKTKRDAIKIVNILYDITERRKNEEELKKAKEEAIKANETKIQFLANMSHEIRTPLNGLLGMVTLLSKSQLDDRQKNYLD